MKILGVLVLIIVAFGAGVRFQQRRDNKRIIKLTNYWHLVSTPIQGIEPTKLDPTGVAVWQCPNEMLFYAPLGYREGLSACKQIGTAEVVLRLQ